MENKERKELRLVDKGKRGILRVIFSRTGIIVLLFALGVALFVNILVKFAEWLPEFVGLVAILHFAVILELVNNDMDATAKNTWLLVLASTPIVGPLFYLYTRIDPSSFVIKKLFRVRRENNRELLPEDTHVLRELEKTAPEVAGLCKYVSGTGNYPVFNGTKVEYYELGEYKWQALMEDLQKAEKFIFLEYFIIDEGKMWGQMLEILAEKAAQGVEVRVMYDGTCEFSTLPHDYPKRLEALGIKCRMFAPMTPFVSTIYNNRDHRKILVIDGKIAYNGGVNLADEYINAIEKYGHWKDTAVRIEGPAVDSFTLMFFEMWMGEESPNEAAKYMVGHHLPTEEESPVAGDMPAGESEANAAASIEPAAQVSALMQPAAEAAAALEPVVPAAAPQINNNPGIVPTANAAPSVSPDSALGYVMPFGDNPMDGEKVGENVYMDFLYRANSYVHIMTPYLILDDEMTIALKTAAQKGIDVELIVPGVPDKALVYKLTKSYFARLIRAGVKIYTYTPGFVHAKVFVSDDCKASVGTINLDYRSLYHHFECATYLYKVPCISQIEWDFLETREKCHRVTLEDVKNEKMLDKFIGAVMRMVAPLL